MQGVTIIGCILCKYSSLILPQFLHQSYSSQFSASKNNNHVDCGHNQTKFISQAELRSTLGLSFGVLQADMEKVSSSLAGLAEKSKKKA